MSGHSATQRPPAAVLHDLDWNELHVVLRRSSRARSHHDREDAVQDALAVLCERLSAGHEVDAPQRFALGVLRHREADLQRARRECLTNDLDWVPAEKTGGRSAARPGIRSMICNPVMGLTDRERDVLLASLLTSTPRGAAVLLETDEAAYGRVWRRAAAKLRVRAREFLHEVSEPND
ncbi:MAG: sigma-70 family RNA polymerase sigma factor [Planctomycetes bacterium]|nr:sigma-70 family RNA polymerase sigma factor [Planctomycetota bacterium]